MPGAQVRRLRRALAPSVLAASTHAMQNCDTSAWSRVSPRVTPGLAADSARGRALRGRNG